MPNQVRIIRKKDQHEQAVQPKLLRNPSSTAHALRLQWLAERKERLDAQAAINRQIWAAWRQAA